MIADRGRATFEVGSQIFIDKKEKGRREQVTERVPLLIIVVGQKSHLPKKKKSTISSSSPWSQEKSKCSLIL